MQMCGTHIGQTGAGSSYPGNHTSAKHECGYHFPTSMATQCSYLSNHTVAVLVKCSFHPHVLTLTCFRYPLKRHSIEDISVACWQMWQADAPLSLLSIEKEGWWMSHICRTDLSECLRHLILHTRSSPSSVSRLCELKKMRFIRNFACSY
jgi:hypothetical protein